MSTIQLSTLYLSVFSCSSTDPDPEFRVESHLTNCCYLLIKTLWNPILEISTTLLHFLKCIQYFKSLINTLIQLDLCLLTENVVRSKAGEELPTSLTTTKRSPKLLESLEPLSTCRVGGHALSFSPARWPSLPALTLTVASEAKLALTS